MSEINIDEVSKKFENHLNIDRNHRIIFSGKFGVGKTFFLKKFFEERRDRFNTFLLSPVNYVISSNEDIFELIKADIIKDLFLTGKINLEKLPSDNTLQKISNYFENNSAVLGNFILKHISKLTTSSEIPKEVIDNIAGIIKGYKQNSAKKKEEEKTRSEQLVEYWSKFEEKVGNIYEHNYVTKVINTFLEEIRTEKKNVLIIDDLDRIDPEHIFRILNILSVHNNCFDAENKFAFDHVILVCDIDNIQKIFYHKYGAEVDFDGYIDKFYSTHILSFTNTDAIITYVKSLSVETKEDKPYFDFLVLLLKNLIKIGAITIRQLIKHKYQPKIEYSILYRQSGIKGDVYYLRSPITFIENFEKLFVDTYDLKILECFKLMTFIFGDFDNFLKNISLLKSINEKVKYKEIFDIVSFLSLQSHISLKSEDDIFVTKYFEQDSGLRHLSKIEWPQNKYLDKQFKINLKWTLGNRYKGIETYFKDASAFPIGNEYDAPEGEITLSSIFESVEQIALACLKKGYLKMADIVA